MVEIIRTTKELLQRRGSEKEDISSVPTMGNLHHGHISLLEEALRNFKTVYFSIFVNPKQFGPGEDFNRYPRTLEKDIELISSSVEKFPGSKVIVYSPVDPIEVFPHGKGPLVSVCGLSSELEGKIRPGHFDGVATVVYRLFDLIKPHTAYFGLKDFQQYLVIKQMVKDLVMPVRIKGMPIVREESGLALSSRNQYLSASEKEASLILSKTLKDIQKRLDHDPKNLPEVKKFIQEILRDKNWNYLEIRDSETFSEEIAQSTNISILAVYQLGQTRLLDNVQVELRK